MHLSLVGRTLFFYVLLLLAVRIMGKREIGRLSPFDLVITIMIAELAALPIETPQMPLFLGALPIATLVVAEVVLSYVCLKSEKARGVICGNPSIVIRDGQIVEKEMKKLRYNLNDLLEQLRQKNSPNVADVEIAVLETNGQLSVIPKSQKRPVCCSDLNLPSSYEGLPLTLVNDGQLDYESLAKGNLDLTWLREQLTKAGVKSPQEVFYCSLDTTGQLYLQKKDPSLGLLKRSGS
ncbi:MAG: DUF421 domain-containing protein [Firmicutes bacterium]|nr:DUF421 domain-containing protein [Bacillota bacterium]